MKYILFVTFALILIFLVYRLKQFYSVWCIIFDDKIRAGKYLTTKSRLFAYCKYLLKMLKTPSELKIVFDRTFAKSVKTVGHDNTMDMVKTHLSQMKEYNEILVPKIRDLIYTLKTQTGHYPQAYLLIHLFLNAGDYHPSILGQLYQQYPARILKEFPELVNWLEQEKVLWMERPDYDQQRLMIFSALSDIIDQRNEVHMFVALSMIMDYILDSKKLKSYFGSTFMSLSEINQQRI